MGADYSRKYSLGPTNPARAMSELQHLLFDLDGTLTDPFQGITASIRHALDRLGVASPDDETLRGWIGPPLRDSFGHWLDTTDEALLDRAIDLYRERFATVGLYENRVYAGIPALLERLNGAGFTLYLATSKPRVFAERILAHFQLEHHFRAIHGSELDGRLSHKADLIRHILLTERITPPGTAMIGDRLHDVHGARHNGVAALGAGWGYGAPGELAGAGAGQVFSGPARLGEWLLATVSAP